MTRAMLSALAPFGVCLMCACARTDSPARAVQVRDSAGIRIVESAAPQWREGEGWRIEAEPFVSIGVAEGDSTQQLFGVTDALRLEDGTIVIADRGTNTVRWYGASGGYMRGAGRSGSGPGEFSPVGPGSMCVLSEGRLLVGDPVQQRANVFGPDGSVQSVLSAPRVGGAFPSIQGCFADGTLQLWHSEGSERVPDTMVESELAWTRIGADGSVLNELGRIPVRMQYLLGTGDGGGTYHTIPFTVRPSGGVGADRFYLTAGASAEIAVRRTDGTIEALWRWTPVGRTRSSDVLARYEAFTIDAQRRPEQRIQWSKFFRLGIDVPEYIASTASLVAADDGHLWAERYRLPWDSVAVWEVFAPGGAWLGGVRLPVRFTLYQIHDDAILGRRVDDDGVERVVLHRLLRGGTRRN